MNESAWLEGSVAVSAVLAGSSRDIQAVYVQKGKWSAEIRALNALARQAGVPVELVDRAFVNARAEGKTHGGVIARVGRRRFKTLDDLIGGAIRPFIAMLDGVEDPYNFGQAIRSLFAAGADGLVVPPRNWFSAANVVARASAGASELLPVAQAETAAAAAAFFREKGLVVACTAKDSAHSIFETDLTLPIFLLIGGEKRGITRSFLAQAELKLTIPYGREYGRSLGVAASTAVIAFELFRQRQNA